MSTNYSWIYSDESLNKGKICGLTRSATMQREWQCLWNKVNEQKMALTCKKNRMEK